MNKKNMNEIGSERTKAWNIYYTSSESSPAEGAAGVDQETPSPWKSFGTSMNAVSFGFVATAILISMFLIMVIFEHLFSPTPSSFSSPEEEDLEHYGSSSLESGQFDKLGHPRTVSTSYAPDLSVVMPGHECPTYIAQPAPLPCSREGIYWPSHSNHPPPSFLLHH